MTPRVLAEWSERIAAEYTSAAVTQHFVLWLMQAGAPPELLDAGLVVVADELAHARLSHDVVVAAGGAPAPALVRDGLGLTRRNERLEDDLLREGLRLYCLGETVAVPLFRHLREPCTQPVARAALDRILRDEVRHRDFGWDVLDWLLEVDEAATLAGAARELPALLTDLAACYGTTNPAVAEDDGAIDAEERAWGLAPPREYASILARTIAEDYAPRFAARGIALPG